MASTHSLRSLVRLTAACAIAVFTLSAGHAQTSTAAPAPVTLTILHTNDIHGHILPFAYTEIGRSPAEHNDVGGAARRATLIRKIRRETKNPILLVDSGDTFTRGPLTTTYLGLADTEAMNAIGYDLATIGNNEFKAKDGSEASDAAGAQAALLSIVKHSRFAWLCANCTDSKGAMLEGVQPFVIRQMGPLRVGFLGLTAPRVASYPQAKGWTITDTVSAAKTYIPLARAQCDVLIAVTHIGVDLDKQLAAQTTGIDAIVGGDSHTYLYKPLAVKNADGSATVPIVQDGEFGTNLGRFDLTFSYIRNGWQLTTYKDELLPIGPKLAEADDVKAAVAPFTEPLMQVVGTLPADRIGKTPDERTHLTTQVIADALRRQTGADLALSAAGDSLFEVFRSPTIRRYDIYAIMPFKDHAVVATLTGAQLKTLIDGNKDSVLSTDAPTPLDPAKSYKVAMIDFVAASTYKLKPADFTDTGKNVYDLMIADLQK